MSTDTGLSFETVAFLHSNFKRLIIEKFYDTLYTEIDRLCLSSLRKHKTNLCLKEVFTVNKEVCSLSIERFVTT